MSRLDTFILSKGLTKKWRIERNVMENRGVLDHCLIWIKANHTSSGMNTFKVFNCWFEHQDFVPFVEEVWK